MEQSRKFISVADFLTAEEIDQAVEKYNGLGFTGDSAFTDWAEKTLIAPNMERINKALGQQNNARFLAYALTYAMGQARARAALED